MKKYTSALEVACPTCFVVEYEMCRSGTICVRHIRAAAKLTREINRASRASTGE